MSHPPEDQTTNVAQELAQDSTTPAAGTAHVAETTGPASVAHEATLPLSPNSNIDRDAQEMVIDSLRTQVQDLFSQVTQLNGKLVQSYDRVSDLEDALHAASNTVRSNALQISQLELERTQHLSALNTGLLVEKSQVTAELTRVMEKATEEAARRGQAESARTEIEKDLDDLSASLFDQANIMVAQARFKQAASERKVDEAERALKGAEEAVTLMQQQMQNMRTENEKALARMEDMQNRMGKGKWVERERSPGVHASVRLLSLHTPYQEFLVFVAHLRSIRPASPLPPPITSMLPLPFLGRLQIEDCDPTIRLDLAPSLNWLSRRSVLAAIHTGELSIEPMATAAMVQELSIGSYSTAALASSIIPGNSHTQNILCALCGTAIFPPEPKQAAKRPPLHPMISRATSMSGSWSSSLFKNPLAQTNGPNSVPVSPTSTKPMLVDVAPSSAPTQVYIFRITTQTGATPQSPNATMQRSTIYPLCQSGWCLARLRSTCSLWSFVRNGIIERVWEEEVMNVPIHAPVPQHATSRDSVSNLDPAPAPVPSVDKPANAAPAAASKPPAPPPRRSKMGGLWGMASSALSAGVERVSSISSSETPKDKEKEALPQTPPRATRAVPPLPTSPSRSPARRSPIPADRLSPPPLPKRGGVRRDTKTKGTAIDGDDGPSKEAMVSPPISTNSMFTTPQEELDENPMSPPIVPLVSIPLSPELHAPILMADHRTPSVAPLAESGKLSSQMEDPPAVPASAEASPELPFTTAPQPASAAEDAKYPSRAATDSPSAPLQTASPAPAPIPPSRTASPARQPPPLPSRTSSPAPAPGSRTGSPAPSGAAPPPLPRRAAARARPLSMAAQAAANSASAAAGMHSAAAPHDSPKEEAPKPPSRVSTPIEVAPVPSATAEEGAPQPSQNADEAPEQPVADASPEEHPVEAGPAVQSTTDDPKPVDSAPTQPNPTQEAAAPPPILESLASMGADANVEATPPPVYTARPAATEVGKGLEDSVIQNGEEQVRTRETDVGSYVGDATWEERTWQELVRLKESMFWARVGGVR